MFMKYSEWFYRQVKVQLQLQLIDKDAMFRFCLYY